MDVRGREGSVKVEKLMEMNVEGKWLDSLLRVPVPSDSVVVVVGDVHSFL